MQCSGRYPTSPWHMSSDLQPTAAKLRGAAETSQRYRATPRSHYLESYPDELTEDLSCPSR